jgi:predicted ATPase with chaperone activity
MKTERIAELRKIIEAANDESPCICGYAEMTTHGSNCPVQLRAEAKDAAISALLEALDAIESHGKTSLEFMKKAGQAIVESGEIGLRAIESTERVRAAIELAKRKRRVVGITSVESEVAVNQLAGWCKGIDELSADILAAMERRP